MTELGNRFVRIELEYDTERKKARVTVDGKPLRYVDMNGECLTGISYLMLQSAAEGSSKGFYVRSLRKDPLDMI